jgi:hypothetical protein
MCCNSVQSTCVADVQLQHVSEVHSMLLWCFACRLQMHRWRQFRHTRCLEQWVPDALKWSSHQPLQQHRCMCTRVTGYKFHSDLMQLKCTTSVSATIS